MVLVKNMLLFEIMTIIVRVHNYSTGVHNFSFRTSVRDIYYEQIKIF